MKTVIKVSDERLRNTRAWAAARIGTLSGAEVIVAACDEALAAREAEPPSDDRQASYDAANDRSHPWYWIQQYAVTDPHMGLRKAVQIAWDMAHPATKSGI